MLDQELAALAREADAEAIALAQEIGMDLAAADLGREARRKQRLGRHAEAREALDRALSAQPASREVPFRFAETPADRTAAARAKARALGVRGMIALRLGDPSAAEPDLRAALDGDLPDPELALYAHGLSAAHYARGDFAGAAEAETRSITLAPENTRYRWALVGSLRKLGRNREARRTACVSFWCGRCPACRSRHPAPRCP